MHGLNLLRSTVDANSFYVDISRLDDFFWSDLHLVVVDREVDELLDAANYLPARNDELSAAPAGSSNA